MRKKAPILRTSWGFSVPAADSAKRSEATLILVLNAPNGRNVENVPLIPAHQNAIVFRYWLPYSSRTIAGCDYSITSLLSAVKDEIDVVWSNIYRQNEDGDLEIAEEEAVIVRRVYAMYLSGMSIVKIKAALEDDNIASPTGKEQWSKHTLEFMLTNTKYYGTSIIFKTHTPEYKAKRKVNDGEVARYASEGNNEAIIPEEMFNRVQEERSRRSNVEIGEDGIEKRKATKYSAIKKQ